MKRLMVLACLASICFRSNADTITDPSSYQPQFVFVPGVGYVAPQGLSWDLNSTELQSQPWWGNLAAASQFAQAYSIAFVHNDPHLIDAYSPPFFAYGFANGNVESVDYDYYLNVIYQIGAPADGIRPYAATPSPVPDAGSTACLLAMGCVGLLLVGLHDNTSPL